METFKDAMGNKITFDFDADNITIVFDMLSKTLGAPESMSFKISEVTAIEVQPPRFMHGASICFIVNGIRYKAKLSDRLALTYQVFDKNTFVRLERLLSLIVKKNGLDGFQPKESVDADVVQYKG